MLNILYQDEHIVAIDKPSGLLVHRSMIDRYETEFAMQMLRDQIEQHVFTVHRLDRPTSGVLLFALSSEVAALLTQQLTDKQVHKTYRAVVRGYLCEQGTLDYALKEKLDKIADKQARQDKPAQDAVTHYRGLETYELPFAVGRYSTARYSLVEMHPETGRKHQLRRHMVHLRHPIVGDTTHGDGKHNRFLKQTFGLNGLALSCTEMRLTHPVTGTPLCIQANIGHNIQTLLQQWRQNGWQQ